MSDLKTLIQWRREFHRFPEVGWSEFVTTAKLVQKLEAMGHVVLTSKNVINPDFVRGRQADVVEKGLAAARAKGVSEAMLKRMDGLTGCAAIFDTGKPGPTIGLRFDIDCIPVQETADATHIPRAEKFASENPGYMHSCGHDGHMSIGLGVAQWLIENRDTLKGRFKLLFQPAEEGVRGARPMSESGILDDVDYFAGSHLGFVAPSGTIVAGPTGFLCTLKIDVRFKGKPAHAGAAPHLGKNALAAACHAATQMLGIARHGEGMTRVNVGVLRAGEGRNVIPPNAELQIEVRGESEELNTYMADEVIRIAKGIALGFDVELATEIMGEAVDLICDDEMVDHVMAVAKGNPSVQNVVRHQLFGGSEDATILARRVQARGGKAVFFVIGADLTAGHHQGEFDFDEKQLGVGVDMYTGLIGRLMSGANSPTAANGVAAGSEAVAALRPCN
jgi:aminobenzoyl-glutamate utilization protein A